MVLPSSVRITEGPPVPEETLRELPVDGCGAIVLVATLARDGALDVTLAPDARDRLERAARGALTDSVRATRISHARGSVPEGRPLVVGAVAAVHRKDAFAAAERLLSGLKGVAERREA